MLLLALLTATPMLADGPFVEQKPDFCGEAVAETAFPRLAL